MFFALRTRQDILVAVLILARFSQAPKTYCYRASKSILRYLRGSINTELVYTKVLMQFYAIIIPTLKQRHLYYTG